MSKRYIFPPQNNERKRPKLDITISDHNFPLSQNPSAGPVKDADNWGDDNDDEILLLASQVCEEAYVTNDNSMLPNYSLCMHPGSTSTQLSDQAGPSNPKPSFTFKKPTSEPVKVLSTNLKDRFSTISTPLMSSKTLLKTSNNGVNLIDDLIFNDKIIQGQDSDMVYKQLLQLQEENAKLKSENGKLLEKCVTKEGEASILRTQLKACQSSVDNARMERIKAQEKVQVEWNDKLTNASSQIHDLRNQLDFKNLEIISIKEKCKLLESSKVKLTQVTVAGNEKSIRNSSFQVHNESFRKVKTTACGVQTDNKALFLKLHKSYRPESLELKKVIPLLIEKETNPHHSLLDYNEKLRKYNDVPQGKCGVFSMFHKVPNESCKEIHKSSVNVSAMCDDLTHIAAGNENMIQEKYFSFMTSLETLLTDLQHELEVISENVTSAFQREMDERYIEGSGHLLCVEPLQLMQGSALYKEEQGIQIRKMAAATAILLEGSKNIELFHLYDKREQNDRQGQLVDEILRICVLLDNTSCAMLYSGVLLSLTFLVEKLLIIQSCHTKMVEIVKNIISARPMSFVSCAVLSVFRKLCVTENPLEKFCPGYNAGNLKTDYDQGVLLYKKDTCYLQILLKQVEAALKCIERQGLSRQAAKTTAHILAIHNNIRDNYVSIQGKPRCECQQVLLEVLVFSLCVCAALMRRSDDDAALVSPLCLHGLVSLTSRRGAARPAPPAGALHVFLDLMRGTTLDEGYANMLNELSAPFQGSPEDAPPSYHRQPWLKSFQSFSIAD